MLFHIFNKPRKASPVEFDELTVEQSDDVFRRVLLARWRHSATPTLREMEDLREVLPACVAAEGGTDAAGLSEALRCGDLPSYLRRDGLGSPGTDDVAMSIAWLACGEGDLLARIWLIDAIGRIVVEGDPRDAASAFPVLKEHLSLAGLDGRAASPGGVRSLVAEVAVGPVPPAAKADVPEHDTMVRAHLDGLAALSLAPGWRESHDRAVRRLGVRTLPLRARQHQADPDDDFTFPEADEFPVPPAPQLPAEPDPAVPARRLAAASFSCAEKHLRPYAALERPLPLVQSPPGDGLAEELGDEFPWLGEVVDHVARSQSLRQRGSTPWFSFAPMLIVGPQGAGKTRIARRLSEVSGVPISRVNAAGRAGAIEILGHSSSYKDAHPSAPVSAICEHGVANPILFIDELGRFGSSDFNGDPRDALIAMLEPETQRAFHDDFLRTDVDISAVNFIFTANGTSGLPPQLLDRLDVFHVSAPGPEHFDALYGSVMADVAKEHGLTRDEMPAIHPLAVAALRRSFRKGTSVRRLKSAVRAAMRASAGHAPH